MKKRSSEDNVHELEAPYTNHREKEVNPFHPVMSLLCLGFYILNTTVLAENGWLTVLTLFNLKRII